MKKRKKIRPAWAEHTLANLYRLLPEIGFETASELLNGGLVLCIDGTNTEGKKLWIIRTSAIDLSDGFPSFDLQHLRIEVRVGTHPGKDRASDLRQCAHGDVLCCQKLSYRGKGVWTLSYEALRGVNGLRAKSYTGALSDSLHVESLHGSVA